MIKSKIKYVIVAILLISSGLVAADFKELYSQANSFYLKRDYDTALKLYQEALAQSPGIAYAAQGEGNCLIGLGRRQEALSAYVHAKQLGAHDVVMEATIEKLNQEFSLPAATTQIALNPPAQLESKPASEPKPMAMVEQRSWVSPLWRSALIPGWGQAYNYQSKKAWLLGSTTWAAFAGVATTYLLGSQAIQSYQDAKSSDEALKAYDSIDSYYVANEIFYTLWAGLYLYTALDSALNANTEPKPFTQKNVAFFVGPTRDGGVMLAGVAKW